MTQTILLNKVFPFSRLCLLPLLYLILLSIIHTSAYAQTFEDFKRADEQNFKNSIDSSEAELFKDNQDWENFQREEAERYDAYREAMLEKWDDFKERTRKNWVEYRDNGNVRSSVDFEKGTVKIEILVQDNSSTEEITEKTKTEVLNTIRDQGSVSGFDDESKPVEPLQSEPVLENQIPGVTTKEDEEEFADEVSKDFEINQTKDDKKVITINFELAPNHIQTRAERFKDLVYNHSKTFNLDPALVFAIIHTESFYNPAARSHANALGLMQLVPNSGGRDAYLHVYKKDGIPSPKHLYDPDNNVKLGTAYLDILSNNYLRNVKNSDVKNFLMIAAYNTGAGNVSKAYTNSTNIKNAFDKINQYSPEQTYDFLIRNLPYDETKDYLKKVVERRGMYKNWSAR